MNLHSRQRRRTSSGFTLLEVLVALAVLAIALGAIIKVAIDSTATVSYLRDRTLAGWVASNKITELLLSSDWPAPGESQGSARMGDRDWSWRLQIGTTDDADLRRLDVSVSSPGSEQVLVELVAFKGRF
jgi:general secretion pathway protein I